MAIVVGVVELELDPDCTPTQRPLMLMWEEATVAVSVSGGTAHCGCCQSPDDDAALLDGGVPRFPLRYLRCIWDVLVTMGLQLSLAVLAFQVTSGSLAP